MSVKHYLFVGIIIPSLLIISNCKKKIDDPPCRNPNVIDMAGDDSIQYEIAYKREEVKEFYKDDSNKVWSNTVSNNLFEYNDNNKITFYRDFNINVSDSVRTIMDIKVNKWSVYGEDPRETFFYARIGGVNYDMDFCNAEVYSNHKAALILEYYFDLPNKNRKFITYVLNRVK